jgi:hypothetical protein
VPAWLSLCRRQPRDESTGEVLDLVGLEWAVGVEAFSERFAVEQEVAADLQGSDEWQIGVGEAQDAVDGLVRVGGAEERGSDRGDLALETVDQLGLVAAADLEPGWPTSARASPKVLYGAGIVTRSPPATNAAISPRL